MPNAFPESPVRTQPPPAPGGTPDELAALLRAWRRRRPPADEAEAWALDELVACLWRRQKLALLEIELLDRLARGEDWSALPRLETIVRYAGRLARAREAVLAELEALRRDRPEAGGAEPAPPEPRTGAPVDAPEARSSEPAAKAPGGIGAAALPPPRHAGPEPIPRPARATTPAARHAAPEGAAPATSKGRWEAAPEPAPWGFDSAREDALGAALARPAGPPERAGPNRSVLLGGVSAAALLA